MLYSIILAGLEPWRIFANSVFFVVGYFSSEELDATTFETETRLLAGTQSVRKNNTLMISNSALSFAVRRLNGGAVDRGVSV